MRAKKELLDKEDFDLLEKRSFNNGKGFADEQYTNHSDVNSYCSQKYSSFFSLNCCSCKTLFKNRLLYGMKQKAYNSVQTHQKIALKKPTL